MIYSRTSSNSIVNQVMNQANGIGQSKTQAKEESGLKGQSGHKISDKNHSIASTQNMRSVLNQYSDFLKSEHGNKIANHITDQSMKDFINHKLDNGSSQGTINTYISTMGKISDNLNSLGINTTRESITDFRAELKENGHSLKSEHIIRINQDPLAIIDKMKEISGMATSAELQLHAGVRLDDATNFTKLTVNEDNTISVEQSKNGRDYTTCQISNELAIKVQNEINNQTIINKSEYSQTLKEATQATGQEYKGTHSLRYDHINSLHQENMKSIEQGGKGMTEIESYSSLSLENGHERASITVDYIKPW